MPKTFAQPDLTTTDRCDRCGATAKVRVKLPPYGELFFCGHHARTHETKLRKMAVEPPSGIPTFVSRHGDYDRRLCR
jgi:peptide subunit release factor 1 (eRF1)